jgi:hypothetical protein
MKKIKELNNIKNIISDNNIELLNKINAKSKEIKMEFAKLLAEEKIKLLSNICEKYSLNFDELKTQFLKPKELNLILIETTEIMSEDINESILNNITINSVKYYYEQKEKGNVYDVNSQIVGIVKNNQPILFNQD